MARTIVLRSDGHEYRVEIEGDGGFRMGDRAVSVIPASDGTFRFAGRPGAVAWAVAEPDTRWVFLDGRTYEFELVKGGGRRERARRHHGSLSAPMPATVRRIDVATGDRVERGSTLVILEAMKMELPVKAAAAGTVTAINCREGDLVQPGTPLIELDEDG
jgi:3-methylcrotonyl-CoA carboxylase alpha subunit